MWDFERPELTWYHMPGRWTRGATTASASKVETPFHAMGTYYGIGMSTFEPTMGITESQTLFMSSYGNGPGGSTAVVAAIGSA